MTVSARPRISRVSGDRGALLGPGDHDPRRWLVVRDGGPVRRLAIDRPTRPDLAGREIRRADLLANLHVAAEAHAARDHALLPHDGDPGVEPRRLRAIRRVVVRPVTDDGALP